MFGWEVEGRPRACSIESCPVVIFRCRTALRRSRKSAHGHLHVANARPHPDPAGVEPRSLNATDRTARVWILVGDDDSDERILDTAVRLGATELWRHHYWAEFNGFNSAFRDPWGSTLILWTKGGTDPVVPQGWTSE